MSGEFLTKMRKETEARLQAYTQPIAALRAALSLPARTPHAFLATFTQNNQQTSPKIIAEIKFSSPSRGRIAKLSDPVLVAEEYLQNGATALSVLTEPNHFHGCLSYLSRIRAAFPLAKILMKDFILSEYQLLQAKLHGADAVLLIVAFLDAATLQLLYQQALALGLTPLVEVHNAAELAVAESIGAELIGVNNRNLHTLKVDLTTAHDLVRQVSKNTRLICESGITQGAEIKVLQEKGYQGFLIGSHFMQCDHPGLALKAMLEEVQHAD